VSKRKYFVDDGQNCIGTFTIDGDSGEARAFGADGERSAYFRTSSAQPPQSVHRTRHSIPAPDGDAFVNLASPAPAGSKHIVQTVRGQP
jgi:hypothetical protein